MSRDETPAYLKTMSRLVAPAPDEALEAERREKLSASLQDSLQHMKADAVRRARRMRGLQAGGLLALAASCLLWWAGTTPGSEALPSPPSPVVASATNPETSQKDDSRVKEDSEVESGTHWAHLITGELKASSTGTLDRDAPLTGAGQLEVGKLSDARVVLENGAQVLAAAQSRLEISSSQQKARKVEDIHLLTGSVSLRVPKLTMQQGLTVTTPEAIVEVRGTAFVVTREAIEAGYVTRVSVSEGLVAVTAGGTELLLQPGDKWESPSTRGPSPALDHSGGKKHPHSTGSNKKTSLTASSLAEQNRLYQSAMHAKRNGLHELAKVRLRQLLASYPSSPLTPGVERELLKLDQVQTQ